MTAPITTDRPAASRRGALVLVVLLYLAAQALFAVHEVGHLVHAEDGPCELCALGGAPALPSVPPPLAERGAPVIPETGDLLPQPPFARVQRVHLPRAPPA
jgi:hypothetical protein